MQTEDAAFEQTILPHLDAACNLARWLAGNEHDADDIVQESCLRAFKFFGGFRGGDARAWLLTIVRNTSCTWFQRNRPGHEPLDDSLGLEDLTMNPDTLFATAADSHQVRAALAQLPAEFREVIVLREMEDYSYKEISGIAGVPIGTVMSRLARGRKQLQRILAPVQQPNGGQP